MYTKGKQDVADALSSIPGVTVTASHNIAIKKLPAILYAEVVNTKVNKGKEKRTLLAYSIDIYSEKSTTSIASQVDDVISALGFKRGTCLDLDDPSGIRHKNMKYTGVYDENTNLYYEE